MLLIVNGFIGIAFRSGSITAGLARCAACIATLWFAAAPAAGQGAYYTNTNGYTCTNCWSIIGLVFGAVLCGLLVSGVASTLPIQVLHFGVVFGFCAGSSGFYTRC